MSLKAGSNQNAGSFANSMAEAMATAFKNEWPSVMGNAPVPEITDQLKLLFAAVAQGVINHLKAHATDFKVTVTATGSGNYKGEVTQID